eukprot:3345600-Rhodomonas_salina.2
MSSCARAVGSPVLTWRMGLPGFCTGAGWRGDGGWRGAPGTDTDVEAGQMRRRCGGTELAGQMALSASWSNDTELAGQMALRWGVKWAGGRT